MINNLFFNFFFFLRFHLIRYDIYGNNFVLFQKSLFFFMNILVNFMIIIILYWHLTKSSDAGRNGDFNQKYERAYNDLTSKIAYRYPNPGLARYFVSIFIIIIFIHELKQKKHV